MVEEFIKMVLCHLLGDYVLQTDFIAQTKGKNWYHLFVHCSLYIVPFYLAFGVDWRLLLIFVSHSIIDPLKVRWNKISYWQDQILHYLVAMVYVFIG